MTFDGSENPGATAIATGVKDVMEFVCPCCDLIADFPTLATQWGVPI